MAWQSSLEGARSPPWRMFVTDYAQPTWRAAYDQYRSNLGRAILLGLELLVAADIIATITAPLTFQSVGLLAAIVTIRTFLSFSLETEIEGCWPWERAARARIQEGATSNGSLSEHQ